MAKKKAAAKTKTASSKRRAMTLADVDVKIAKHSRLLEKAIKRARRAVNRIELHRAKVAYYQKRARTIAEAQSQNLNTQAAAANREPRNIQLRGDR